MTRIPITMCHGLRTEKQAGYPLPGEHFERLVGIARDLGFESIDYDQLHAWREAGGALPDRPIMFDFDHPDHSMRHGVHDIIARHGYRGNLFINTGWFDPEHDSHGQCMSWDEVRELVDLGWHIGAEGRKSAEGGKKRRRPSHPRPVHRRRRRESVPKAEPSQAGTSAPKA